jgi:LL-diaminopimelate aminotransferase
MVKRNPNFLKVSDRYLFSEVGRQIREYKEKHPERELVSLSLGDTSEPLSATVVAGLSQKAIQLGTRGGYQGYGPEQGDMQLRYKIAEVFYPKQISADEIFISDGAKCDIGRLQLLFGQSVSIAVQDPTYPAYVDTSLLVAGRPIISLPCHPGNGFFPTMDGAPHIDLLYLSSPNNPTGAVATKEQLQTLVGWAKKKGALVIFDAAYSGFIQDPTLPRSIYEIEGADEVAIEVSSFSKLIGFTGVRLGWSVIPKKVCFEGGDSVHKDFTRLITTFFNGASIIAQAGALAALSEQGISEMKRTTSFYLENALLIKKALKPKGFPIYGGENAPYLWVDFDKQNAWDLFHTLLEHTGVIATPGSGFGPQGEGFLRFTSFGAREHVLKAIDRIEKRWPAAF